MQNTKPSSSPVERIVSIDALRGITILVMIFVNDLAGVQSAPAWMKHFPGGQDGMTFVDLVFPAFLFIVGMSVPFAIGQRLDKGESLLSVLGHILTRTLGLLIIGVFMVNTESMRDSGSFVSALWKFLMYASVVMVWNIVPREEGQKKKFTLFARAAGIIILIVLAFLYKGEHTAGVLQMRTYWWGILGLIGWAYLGASLVYILFRKNSAIMMGMIALFYCIALAGEVDFFSWTLFTEVPQVFGSLSAITLSGIVLGMILKPESGLQTAGERIRWALIYGLGMLVCGIMLHSLHDVSKLFIICKNDGTLPWCLISAALTTFIWIAMYWITDVQGWKRWTALLLPASQNPLLAYILAPMFYAFIELTSLGSVYFDTFGGTFATGFTRSIVFAFFINWLTGLLNRNGLRLRL